MEENKPGVEKGNLAQKMYWADLTLSWLMQPPCLGCSDVPTSESGNTWI